jgi:hypothetical protein
LLGSGLDLTLQKKEKKLVVSLGTDINITLVPGQSIVWVGFTALSAETGYLLSSGPDLNSIFLKKI